MPKTLQDGYDTVVTTTAETSYSDFIPKYTPREKELLRQLQEYRTWSIYWFILWLITTIGYISFLIIRIFINL